MARADDPAGPEEIASKWAGPACENPLKKLAAVHLGDILPETGQPDKPDLPEAFAHSPAQTRGRVSVRKNKFGGSEILMNI